jgi:hypothetical protein
MKKERGGGDEGGEGEMQVRGKGERRRGPFVLITNCASQLGNVLVKERGVHCF